MKKVYLSFFFLALAGSAMAVPRTLKQKMDIAATVLQNDTEAGAKASANGHVALKELMAKDNLSVIGYDQGGFVIVSNDDEARPVVGFSSGVFDASANPSLRWYLNAANASLSAGAPLTVVAPTQFEGVQTDVAPLLTCTWNQGAPYNLLTPTYGRNNTHYVTGCVATAMSQVMYYHKYPAQGQNTHSYNFMPTTGQSFTLTVDYSKEIYDWSLMVDNYTGSESAAQQNEVAKLMFDAGVSCSMMYNEDGSGAYTYEAANALVEYFNYNENLQLYTRSGYSEALWMKKIYDEISHRRPIIYAGADANNQGGHEFVLDGYRSDGFVHINWGWGGSSDGYYDIALLNPTGYQFSAYQEMVMGVARPDETVTPETQFISTGGLSYTVSTTSANTCYLSCSANNMGRNQYQGPVAVVARDETGGETVLRYFTSTGSRGSDTPVDYSFFHGNSGTFTIRSLRYGNLLADKPDGTYRLYIGTQAGGRWCPVHALAERVNSIVVNKQGDTYTVNGDTDDLWMYDVTAATAINSMTTTKPAIHNHATYNIAGQRVGDNYKGIVIQDGKKMLRK